MSALCAEVLISGSQPVRSPAQPAATFEDSQNPITIPKPDFEQLFLASVFTTDRPLSQKTRLSRRREKLALEFLFR